MKVIQSLLWILGLGLAGDLSASTWQLRGNLQSTAVQNAPGPVYSFQDNENFDLFNKPEARLLQRHEVMGATPNGGRTEGHFEGRIGLLRATASASYPYCCDIAGHRIHQGYTNTTVQGQFYDTLSVFGGGLAFGTAVRYTVHLDISGRLSQPNFEMGGFLTADGLAEVRLSDLTTRETSILRWNAKQDAVGQYLLSLDTFVGHELGLSGMLYAAASVSDYAQTARSTFADFGHSALFELSSSVAGMNLVGASGHDFARQTQPQPVPAPASLALVAVGLLAWRLVSGFSARAA